VYTFTSHSYFLFLFLFWVAFAFAFALFIIGFILFHILRVCAVIIALLAIRALSATDFCGENKVRLTSFLRLSGDLIEVVILDSAFATAFVLGVIGALGFFGVDTGEGVLFLLGVFAIYYTHSF
jgi:Zn-dependent protease with chaperone function